MTPKNISFLLKGLLLSLFFQNVAAQITFTEQGSTLLSNPLVYSGVTIGAADMNGDKKDDIIHFVDGQNLHIEYQTLAGQVFTNYNYGNVSNEKQWSICIADVDGNGYNDLISGGSYDNVKLLTANADGTAFTESLLPNSLMFIQASNFVDMNNDGWVDIFACHDDAESRIWANDGTGNFVEADDWIDMATVPSSDNSGNYGSVWTDYDNDGDLDLYIAKCRIGAANFTDPRRINVLYQNDGQNNYTEVAQAVGLQFGDQSWTTDFADIDNDGDLDCLVTNHDTPSLILENNGAGIFTDITVSTGVDIQVTTVQALFEDFNNDGWIDLLVAGSDYELYLNDGDGTFTLVGGFPFTVLNMESFAIGDFNHDGFLDVYAGYAQLYNTPSSTLNDRIWINDANSNHYFVVSLEGTASNINGIGSRVELYGPWGQQIREVRAGESYGTVHTFNQHFGLGSSTQIDSVVVKWPSGAIDRVANPSADQFLTIVENSCTSPNALVTANGPSALCDGASVELLALPGYTYLWSTGETTQAITVSTTGNYRVALTNGTGCIGVSKWFEIVENPIEIPEITIGGELEFCEGEGVSLSASTALGYLWSNGETTQNITATATGNYSVEVQGSCEQFSSSTVVVNVLPAPMPTVTNDTVIGSGSATLNATGNDLTWYDEPTGGTVLMTGTTYTTPFLSNTTSYFVEDHYQYGGEIFYAGKVDNAGGGGENSANFNGNLIFDVTEAFTLLSVKVYAIGEENRTIQLKNSDGQVLEEVTVNIPNGESRVTLNFSIPAELGLELGCATDPSMYRNNNAVFFPYDIGDYGQIVNSVYGTQYYYYFYDWEVEGASRVCVSERATVEAVTLPVVQVTALLQGAYDLATGFMNTHLQTADIIPLNQPFNRPPWLYNGAESVATSADIPANTVDWVLVEVRDVTDNSLIIDQLAAFLLADGRIVQADGSASGIYFKNAVAGTPYHIVVRHRNHLAVMSANPIVFTNGVGYDFTLAMEQAMGMEQQIAVDAAVFALYAGDFDSDGVLSVSDFNLYQTQASQINVYVEGDANLDNNVTVTDFNLYQPNSSIIGVSAIRY